MTLPDDVRRVLDCYPSRLARRYAMLAYTGMLLDDVLDLDTL